MMLSMLTRGRGYPGCKIKDFGTHSTSANHFLICSSRPQSGDTMQWHTQISSVCTVAFCQMDTTTLKINWSLGNPFKLSLRRRPFPFSLSGNKSVSSSRVRSHLYLSKQSWNFQSKQTALKGACSNSCHETYRSTAGSGHRSSLTKMIQFIPFFMAFCKRLRFCDGQQRSLLQWG